MLGRGSIPAITDLDQARQAPELAVLSVAAHADEPGAAHIALAAIEATADLDRDRDRLYPDFVFALLGRVARAAREKLMATSGKIQYQSDFAREYYGKGLIDGEARGEAKMLLKMLALRGFVPTDAQRERILGCTDSDVLDAWADRVIVARTLDEVFAD